MSVFGADVCIGQHRVPSKKKVPNTKNNMGRRNARWDSNTYEIYIIGEQLRVQMHDQGQVRDRRYHLRKYKKCFIGRDSIDWVLKLYHVQSRDEAVTAMRVLQQYGVIHHVSDDQDFKDQHMFYRFTYDDDTYKLNRDLTSFYRGLEIYRKMKSALSKVMQDVYHKGTLYSEAFYGCDAVDFIMVSEGAQEREAVVKEFRDLLERDIIKHVTDDYHFSDDKLIYEFSLDFNKPCLLQDVVDMMAKRQSSDVTSASGVVQMEEMTSHREEASSPVHIKGSKKATTARPPDSVESTTRSMSASSGSSPDSGGDTISMVSQALEPRSVLVRPISVQELEDPRAPYVKRSMRIECDVMGFGFVLRGSSPCYVQTVDPLGPAAAAGLRVRHFISTVNGEDVLRMDHRQVGQIIGRGNQLTLTVLVYRRDADTP